MNTFGKFRTFDTILEEASGNWLFQEALRKSSIQDIRYVFQSLTINELKECLTISAEKEQYELCGHLKVLISEKQSR